MGSSKLSRQTLGKIARRRTRHISFKGNKDRPTRKGQPNRSRCSSGLLAIATHLNAFFANTACRYDSPFTSRRRKIFQEPDQRRLRSCPTLRRAFCCERFRIHSCHQLRARLLSMAGFTTLISGNEIGRTLQYIDQLPLAACRQSTLPPQTPPAGPRNNPDLTPPC